MKFLKELGAKVIVVSEQGTSIQGKIKAPIFKNKPTLQNDEWAALARGLNTLGEIAKENNMKIAYHHHMGTVVQTMDEIDKLMSITNPKFVWLLADTGHMYYSDGNDSPSKLLKKYSERIVHIHLKDIRDNVKDLVMKNDWSFLKGVKEGVFTVPGDGNIDFKTNF
jgi:inosose dehydratase